MNIFYDECRRKNFKDSLNSLWVPLNFGKPDSFSHKWTSRTSQLSLWAQFSIWRKSLNFCCEFLPFCGHGFHVFWTSLSFACELFLASEENLWTFILNAPNFLTPLWLFLNTIQLWRTSQLCKWVYFSIWRKSLNFDAVPSFWNLTHLNFGEPLNFVYKRTLNSEERLSTFSVNTAHLWTQFAHFWKPLNFFFEN